MRDDTNPTWRQRYTYFCKNIPKQTFCFGTRHTSEFDSPHRTLVTVTASFIILPSSSILTILPSDDILQVTDTQIFQRFRQPSQNSTRQMADMKQSHTEGPKKSVDTIQKFSRPGSVYPWSEMRDSFIK
jgi:hypothetical protein